MPYFNFNRKAVAMKTFTKALILAAFSMTVGGPLAHMALADGGTVYAGPALSTTEQDFGYFHAASACPGNMATEAEFFKTVIARKIPVRTFTASGQAKVIGLLNGFRSKSNTPPLPADTMLYVGDLNAMEVGLVMMSEGCVIAGSVETMPKAMLTSLTHLAKVMEEEMIAYVIGESI